MSRDVRSIPNSSRKLSLAMRSPSVSSKPPHRNSIGVWRDVAPEELIRRPAPEKWSIAEIIAHLADAELAMGWRLRNMLAESGRGLNVVGSGRMGGSLGLRAARCEPFGRGLPGAAREQPATVGVGPARTVGGVLWGPRGTRTANGRGVRPPGSGTRLEPSSADRPHIGWAYVGLPYLHQALLAFGHPGGLAVTLIDPDTVSETNCVRQPFCRTEIGCLKAIVLAPNQPFLVLNWQGASDDSTAQERHRR